MPSSAQNSLFPRSVVNFMRTLARPLTRLFAVLASVLLMLTLLAVPQEDSPLPQAQAQQQQNPSRCGSSVAFVVDLSNSLQQSDVTNLKTTLRSVVDSLAGAPYTVGLYSFGTNSPYENLLNVTSQDLRTAQGRQAVDAAIDALYNRPDSNAATGATNWEAGLQAVADDMSDGTASYDVVYFITDGQPTVQNSGSNYGPGTAEESEIDAAVVQSGRISNAGGQVIPVGVNMPQSIQIREPLTLLGFPLWWPVSRTVEPRELLGEIASSGASPIIVNNYANLANQLITNFAVGCLQIVKEVVDDNGNIIGEADTSDWSFDLTNWSNLPATTPRPSSARTNAGGVAEISVRGTDPTAPPMVTITEQEQPGYTLRQSQGRNAQCTAYRVGQSPRPVTTSNSGSQGIRVALDANSITTCTFRNVPNVPLNLEKRVEVNQTQLQDELNNRSYAFSYECRTSGGPISGQETLTANTPVAAAGQVPVGAECTVTEQAPEVDDGRFDVTTSWSGQHLTGLSGNPGLTTTFRIGEEAYLTGLGARITALNTYDVETATISVRKHIENRAALPADQIPPVFTVRYACRYVPDPNDPPEQNPGGPNPYHVAEGTVAVPSDGTAVQIVDDEVPGGFPVGTQCLYEEIAAATSPITIDGFDLTTTWNSDICLADSGSDVNGLDVCATNYTWIPAAGDHLVEVSNGYQRQTGAVEITKELTGAAAELGQGQPFFFDVRCTQGGTTIFEETDLTVAGGGSYRLTGVPVGVDCTVTEQAVDIPGAEITFPAPQTFTVANPTTDAAVSLSNALEYQMGEVRVSKQVDVAQVADPAAAAALSDARFPVTAECTAPGQQPVEYPVDVAAGATAVVGTFPLGTTCSFTEEFTPADIGVDGVDHLAQFSASTVTVSSAAGEDVQLRNAFRTSASDLVIAKTVNVDSTVPDLTTFLPSSYTIDYTCTDGSVGSVQLSDGESQAIPGFSPGASCTLSENIVDALEVERDTTFTGSGGTQTGTQYQVQFGTDGSGVSVNVTNSYTPAYATVEVDKEVELLDAADQPVTGELRAVLLGAGRSFSITYECIRGDTVVGAGSAAIRKDAPVELDVPVGADCVFSEQLDGTSIPSTDGPEITYTGTGASNGAENEYTLTDVTGTDNLVMVNNSYDLQTGSFNVKKKVDGEGVATISAEKDYALNYVCTFNGLEVATGTHVIGRFDDASDYSVDNLPVGTACTVTEDPETGQVPNAEWNARWTVAAGPTGWEGEQSCGTAAGCAPGEEHYSANLIVQPERSTWEDGDTGETIVPTDYFQGTLVVWNTYTYEKVDLAVDKLLAEDGVALAADDTFTFDLVCTDPDFADSGLGDQPYVSDPTIRQVVEVTGDGTVVAARPVPVGYDCAITERQVNGYDAEVSTSFENAGTDTGAAVDPTLSEGATAEFSIDPAVYGEEPGDTGTYEVTVTNSYLRDRADLALNKEMLGASAGTVNDYLANPGSFPMQWRCTDPHLADMTYEGAVDVPTDGSPVTVSPNDAGERLPASVTCIVDEDVSGQVPPELADTVTASHNVRVTRGGEPIQLTSNTTVTEEFLLDATEETLVTFQNSYSVDQVYLGFTKYIEGDPDAQVADPATTPFSFTYICHINNLLPDQPAPEIPDATTVEGGTVTGSFELRHGETWSSGPLPTGSYCEISEEVNPEFAQAIDDAGLRLAINYVYPAEGAGPVDPGEQDPTDPDQVPQPVIGDEVRIPLEEGETVQIGGDRGPFAWLLNSLFFEEGEIQVHKVNPGGDPLSGARFAIHPVDPDTPDQPAETPIVEDLQFAPQRDADGEIVTDDDGNPVPDPARFVARLEPGTYYLVETRSGTDSQLLPAPWRFSVEQINADDPWSDLEFRLASTEQYSGLVEIVNDGATDGPAIIQVANVEAGDLPLTGGRGLGPGLVAGALLLLAAVAFYLRRRA